MRAGSPAYDRDQMGIDAGKPRKAALGRGGERGIACASPASHEDAAGRAGRR